MLRNELADPEGVDADKVMDAVKRDLFRLPSLTLAVALCQLAIHLLVSPAVAQERDPPATQRLSITDLSITADQLKLRIIPLPGTELAELSEVWQVYLRQAVDKTIDLKLDLEEVQGVNAEKVRSELAAATDAKWEVAEKYEIVLNAWERKGGAVEDLNPHLDYLSAMIFDTVRIADPSVFLQASWKWITSNDGGMAILLRLLSMVVSIWAVIWIARVLRRATERMLNRVTTISRLLRGFILTAVYWVVLLLGALIALGFLGVNVTPLFAVFGGLSFIVGFAMQETLGNLASGLMIMVLKPFDTGDYIQISGTSGEVENMSVVSTTLRTFDNQIIVVPNSKIWGDVITNVSASDQRRVDLVFGIAYSDNAAAAIEVLTSLLDKHALCLKHPEATVFVGELGDSSVNIFCRPWVRTEHYWDVYWGLTGQAKEAFDAAGISIPFPQRDVHLHSADLKLTAPVREEARKLPT